MGSLVVVKKIARLYQIWYTVYMYQNLLCPPSREKRPNSNIRLSCFAWNQTFSELSVDRSTYVDLSRVTLPPMDPPNLPLPTSLHCVEGSREVEEMVGPHFPKMKEDHS